MSDLRDDFPVLGDMGMNLKQTIAATDWIARFHATCWELRSLNGLHEGLWAEGGYWKLSARSKEFESMDTRKWGRLKLAAHAIAERLEAPGKSGPGWTIIHGDFKNANILFSKSGDVCAAVDFQYCGQSYGARDLAMLLVAGIDLPVDDLSSGLKAEEVVLKRYHDQLSGHLKDKYGMEAVDAFPPWLLLQQFELAMLDLVRFFAGWGFFGNVNYAKQRAMGLLDSLDNGGRDKLGPAEYRQAIAQRFTF
eukprot:gene33520-43321_t